MKLKLQATKDYNEVKRVMDYVNSHSSTEGRFNKIEWGNLLPEQHEHPILICRGDTFLRVGDEKYPLELARSYLGPKSNISDKDTGIYMRVSRIISSYDNIPGFIWGGILSQLRIAQSDDKLFSEEMPYGLVYQPIDASRIEEVDTFFSKANSIIKLLNDSQVREKVKELEKILLLA